MRRSRSAWVAIWVVAALLIVPNAWAGEIGQLRVTEAELMGGR